MERLTNFNFTENIYRYCFPRVGAWSNDLRNIGRTLFFGILVWNMLLIGKVNQGLIFLEYRLLSKSIFLRRCQQKRTTHLHAPRTINRFSIWLNRYGRIWLASIAVSDFYAESQLFSFAVGLHLHVACRQYLQAKSRSHWRRHWPYESYSQGTMWSIESYYDIISRWYLMVVENFISIIILYQRLLFVSYCNKIECSR